MRLFLLGIISAMFPFCAVAQDTASDSKAPQSDTLNKESKWNLHFQTTYIYQEKPSFKAAYSGPNSLMNTHESVNSITATLFVGVRLWKGAEFYFNPEVAGGRGLSGAFGLAASTNGETFRVGDPDPSLYIGRAYIQQTIPLHPEQVNVDDAVNKLAGHMPTDYIQLFAGKFSLADFFDNNIYANSPRNQFLNWELMNNGAWDYAANLRGYTYSFAAIAQIKSMTYKACIATLPTVANGGDLNTNLSEEYALNAEIDKTYSINKQQGHIRLLGYYNNGRMGNYKQAIQNYFDSANPPDVIATRKYGRDKYGFGISADQQINNDLGVFARLGWNDGTNETYCFTESDEVVSAGLSLAGNRWNRKDDNIGFGVIINGLSPDHKQYLADGGLGFQLGDGKLNYGHETATELYYSWKPATTGLWLTADYQFIANPGYNKDRGPVNVFSFRVHVEF